MIERRSAKRFQVGWPIRVEGGIDTGSSFIQEGMLRNLSSNGALLALANNLSTGTQLDIHIRLPLTGEKWMKYPASVVRTEVGFAAVKFESQRPEFGIPLV